MRWREAKKAPRQVKSKEPLIRSDSIFPRVKSFIIDCFMIYTPILYVMTYFIYGGAEEFRENEEAHIYALLLFLFIDSLLNGSGKLSTPGKKAYEQSVVDINSGERLGFFRYLSRGVIFLFFSALLIGFVVPFYRKDRRGIHDVLTNSVLTERRD